MADQAGNVNVIIDKGTDGELTFRHPDGKDAIELGKNGIITCSLGTGFAGTPEIEFLEVKFNGTPITLNLDDTDELTADYADERGPQFFLYSNLRKDVYIRDNSDMPASGEWDVEFLVGVKDDTGSKTLDPEIKLKSGVAPQTASWVAGNAG